MTLDNNSDDKSRALDGELDFEAVSELFLEEYRAGARPVVEDYASRFPQFADDIRELFPALTLLEKGGSSDSLASYSNCVGTKGVEPTELERLKHFRILREVGRGGMGVVYEAWDESLDRVVALKVMKIFPGEEEQTIQRFSREAKMAARLHHTNIVPVYGYDAVDDHFFYAMQLIDGVSLDHFLKLKEKEAQSFLKGGSRFDFLGKAPCRRRTQSDDDARETSCKSPRPGGFGFDAEDATVVLNDPTNASDETREISSEEMERLAKDGPFSRDAFDRESSRRRGDPTESSIDEAFAPSETALVSMHIASANYYQRVADLGIQAARALDYAARHNVIHRDIKPSNLIVDYDGVLWITDFGLAKSINENDLTRQGQLVGTLRYLAPEALDGHFSPLTDVYSLGLTLYEMLTFTPAFSETTYPRLFAQVAEASPVRPRKINPNIPLDLETIILKAIDRSSEKRYSAAEMADDLQRFLDERPIRARRVGVFERVWRWCKRNKLTASLLTMILTLVVVILSIMSTSYVKLQSLLAEKNVESTRAEANLSLALNAFDKLFETLVSGVDSKIDFLEDYSSYESWSAESSISERDARALDQMLDFYGDFLEANENDEKDPELMYRSARAFFRTGLIRRTLGFGNYYEAFKQAFGLYQASLDEIDDARERERIILETARLTLALYESAPPDEDETKLEERWNQTLDNLREIQLENNLDQRDRLSARLHFARVEFKSSQIRRAHEILNVGFFEKRETPKPTPEQIEDVQAGFEFVDHRIAVYGAVDDFDRLKLFAKYYAIRALWTSALRRPEETLRYVDQSVRYTEKLAKLYPDNQLTFFNQLGVYYIKARVIVELQSEGAKFSEGFDPDKEVADALACAVDSVETLVKKYPESSFNHACRAFIYYYCAKIAAVNGQMDKIEPPLLKSIESADMLAKERPSFNSTPYVVQIYSGYAEFLVAQGRFDDAKECVDRLDEELQKDVERNAKVQPSDSNLEKSALMRERLEKQVERVKTIFSDALERNA